MQFYSLEGASKPLVSTCSLHVVLIQFIICGPFNSQAINLKDCDVYTYQSDMETDPFGGYNQASTLESTF